MLNGDRSGIQINATALIDGLIAIDSMLPRISLSIILLDSSAAALHNDEEISYYGGCHETVR